MYDKYGDEIDITLQLHDALYVQCDDNKESVERTKNITTECMVRPITIGFEEFIIGIDFNTGYYWGDLDDNDDYVLIGDEDV